MGLVAQNARSIYVQHTRQRSIRQWREWIVRDVLKGMVVCVQAREIGALDTWITKQCLKCQRDPRWEKIQVLLMEQS